MLPIDISRRSALKLLGAGAAATTIGTGSAAAGRGGETLFEFGRMRGNQRPFVGDAEPIRGLNAGGLPWVVEEAEAKLEAGGRLKVEVEGLVLDPSDAAVQDRGLGGVNPVDEFKAILSCLTIGDDGERLTVNTETGTVPASQAGDAEIEAELGDLPDPCYAPIVFVTSPGGSWFAATGF